MKVGDKVLCIDDSIGGIQNVIFLSQYIPNWPKAGKFYTIRDIVFIEEKKQLGLLLEELRNPILPNKKVEPTFSTDRFVKPISDQELAAMIEEQEKELELAVLN